MKYCYNAHLLFFPHSPFLIYKFSLKPPIKETMGIEQHKSSLNLLLDVVILQTVLSLYSIALSTRSVLSARLLIGGNTSTVCSLRLRLQRSRYKSRTMWRNVQKEFRFIKFSFPSKFL